MAAAAATTYTSLIDYLSKEPANTAVVGLEGLTPQRRDDLALSTFVTDSDATEINQRLLKRFETVTGRRPHRYLRRTIVFCHRELEVILDNYEQGRPFYLFTGRGPSSESLHLGHSIPFKFTQWLQDVFKAKLIIMLTDDMKLLHDKDLALKDIRQYDIANAKDILAFGFDIKRTFMFSNIDFVGGAFYQNIIALARQISIRSVKSALGFNDDHNVGMFYCCSTQSAGCFPSSFPGILGTTPFELSSLSCLVACSYDVDGYFTEVRQHAQALGHQKPAFLYSSLLPSMKGGSAKMSASINSSAIFLGDGDHEIRQKLNAAFPIGGMDTETVFQWLRFFMEDDDELLRTQTEYDHNQLLNMELRDILTETVLKEVGKFRSRRVRVTSQLLKDVMTQRLLA